MKTIIDTITFLMITILTINDIGLTVNTVGDAHITTIGIQISRPLYGGGSGVCVYFVYVYIVL